MIIKIIIIATIIKLINAIANKGVINKFVDKNELNTIEHSTISDSDEFPYVVAVLKGNNFISTGALIDEEWVLTSADGVYLLEELPRLLRIRLGSINYKKGGELRAVKLLEIHPDYENQDPSYDVALMMLSTPVRCTENLKPIRLQAKPAEVTATHFIVTYWNLVRDDKKLANSTNQTAKPLEMFKRHRLLSVTHLHPTETDECESELKEIGTVSDGTMCLEPEEPDICLRHSGAPVVLNDILWGITSSFTVENCNDSNAAPVFVSLVSSKNISTWIYNTVHDHRWYQRPGVTHDEYFTL